jgi:hypothetical protein
MNIHHNDCGSENRERRASDSTVLISFGPIDAKVERWISAEVGGVSASLLAQLFEFLKAGGALPGVREQFGESGVGGTL